MQSYNLTYSRGLNFCVPGTPLWAAINAHGRTNKQSRVFAGMDNGRERTLTHRDKTTSLRIGQNGKQQHLRPRLPNIVLSTQLWHGSEVFVCVSVVFVRVCVETWAVTSTQTVNTQLASFDTG